MRLAVGERERCGIGCRRHGGTLRIRGPKRPGQRRRGQRPGGQRPRGQRRGGQRRRGHSANGQPACRRRGDGANAVDAAGNPFNFNQTAAEALASMNCTVAVPANPLSAQGLATPWQLGDGCTWANGGTEGVFVDATILSPNGQLTVYDPLVINQGTTPAVAPTPPTIAAGSQVILSVGFNGNALALVGPGVRQGNCIDAFGNSLINQTPQCNAANFYRMANAEIARGTLTIPPAGTGNDGQAVPDHA